MRFFVFFFLVLGSLQGMSKAPVAENIGVRTLDYEDMKRKRPVVVELWYPTNQSGPIEETADHVWVHPKEIRNVPLANGKYPLIIMSHGHSGDRRYLSWLAEQLVQKGYLVASVEHYGNSWRTYSPMISLRFWERAKDISYALTQLLSEPSLKNQIDPNRIGFIGYSLGGMTGLALGGAVAQNVKETVTKLQKNFKECSLELVEETDFTEAQGNFVEPRIKAMVLLSPATFIFPPSSLKQVKIPVALVASEGDEVLPFKDHAHPIIKHLVPAKTKVLNKISHYVFINRVSEKGKKLLRDDIQTETIQSDRITVHREVGNFVAEFFKDHL